MKSKVLLVAVSLALSACGGGGATSQAQPVSPGPVTKSALSRNLSPQVSDADLAAVVASNNDFAVKAFPLLAPGSSANAVFSPYSLTEGLALSAAGANGNTLAGMQQALSFTLPQSNLNPALNKLNLLLTSETSGGYTSNAGQVPNLTVANAIWAQQGFNLQPAYLDTLAVNYGAGLNLLDFSGNLPAATAAINSWATQQTNGKITNLVNGILTTGTRLVLTNAVYFKASWATPFPVQNTSQQSFTHADGTTSTTAFMQHTVAVPYAQSGGAQAVDIPYVGNDLSMLIVVPDAGTFNAYQSSLTSAKLNDLVSQLALQYKVTLAMPKFSFNSTPNVMDTLKSLGMTDAFNASAADFSGIDGQHDLSIGAIAHQAFISVDELGSEAAAATATSIGITVANPVLPLLNLTVDRPFLFFIRDVHTGAIIFMGRVVTV